MTVYRLVAEDTVDRDILDLAARKRVVNERVMAASGDVGETADEPDSASVAAALAKALAQYQALSQGEV